MFTKRVVTMSLLKLKLSMLLTLALLLGTLTAIFGLILWYNGAKIGTVGGIIAVIGFSAIIAGLQWYIAPWMIKYFTRMREVDRGEAEYRWIHEMVEKIASKAGIPKPKIYLVQDGSPNAFAFGRTPSSSNIAIHTGLLNLLNKEEVEGVVAHEIGHIKHWDVAIITMASMVPLIVYYAIILFFARQNRDEQGGFGSVIAIWIGAFIAQMLSSLIVMQLSRTRESYADAFSAVVTGKPAALRTGLAKITYGFSPQTNAKSYQGMRAFYIADPINSTDLAKELEKSAEQKQREGPAKFSPREIDHAIEWEKSRGWMQFFSTHPYTYKRIAALNEIEKDIKSGKISLAAV